MGMRGFCFSLFAVPAILAVCAPTARAQDKIASAAQSETPDWSGYYRLARGKDLGDFKPVNMDLDKAIIPHLQPWAKAKMEATDGVADDTGAVCLGDGIFRYPPFAGSFIWLNTPNKIVMVFTEINTAGIRRIYLNRKHPLHLLPTWNGDSIGHWEGDTLVVDTIGFNDKSWLMSAMEPHTEEAHLTERIRQVANGQMIEIKSVVEDRHALTSAYTYTRYYKRNDAAMPAENVCNDEIADWKDWRNKALKKQFDREREVK
jgi:hypothetical protein